MGFVEISDLDSLKESKRKLIDINKNRVLLFYLEGKVYAIDAVCPHQHGPLEEGELHDEEIVCPWHGFMFNVKNGKCLNFPNYTVKSYLVKLDGEKVKIFVE